MGLEKKLNSQADGLNQVSESIAWNLEKKAIITIDGPAGGGKSTISRMLAHRLGLIYLDTGAMYRAVALHLKRLGLDLEALTPSRTSDSLKAPNQPELDQNLAPTDAINLNYQAALGPLSSPAALETSLANLVIELLPAARKDDDIRVFLNGEEVSGAIRSPEMALAASRVSACPQVRRKLTELQRHIAASGGLVAEGRDMGTVVFPTARYKFYLDASPEIRAQRRCEQMRLRGEQAVYQEILKQIQQRDHADCQRPLAPLRAAADALIIDSSTLGPEAVLGLILSEIKKKWFKGLASLELDSSEKQGFA